MMEQFLFAQGGGKWKSKGENPLGNTYWCLPFLFQKWSCLLVFAAFRNAEPQKHHLLFVTSKLILLFQVNSSFQEGKFTKKMYNSSRLFEYLV